jgi:hypothetical protein
MDVRAVPCERGWWVHLNRCARSILQFGFLQTPSTVNRAVSLVDTQLRLHVAHVSRSCKRCGLRVEQARRASGKPHSQPRYSGATPLSLSGTVPRERTWRPQWTRLMGTCRRSGCPQLPAHRCPAQQRPLQPCTTSWSRTRGGTASGTLMKAASARCRRRASCDPGQPLCPGDRAGASALQALSSPAFKLPQRTPARAPDRRRAAAHATALVDAGLPVHAAVAVQWLLGLPECRRQQPAHADRDDSLLCNVRALRLAGHASKPRERGAY